MSLLRAVVAAALLLSAARAAEKPIQDNSFLLEEAYNQEPGVIQHISLFQRDRESGDWVYAFTEEWPAGGQAHQASITVPVEAVRQADGSRRTGIGDVALNYRWQAVGDGDAPVAVSPRLTALLPTGDAALGHGAGGAGVQVNLPVSAILGTAFVGHFNLGAAFIPSARTDLGRGPQLALNLGQGLIWLLHPNLNLMLEAVYLVAETDTARGTVRDDSFLVSPGVRGAVNLPFGVQVVAGLGFPVGFGPSTGERGVLGYLSFEHAAWDAGE
jgi:hypothetical protein